MKFDSNRRMHHKANFGIVERPPFEKGCTMKQRFILSCLALAMFSATPAAYAGLNSISMPITQANTKTYTTITAGGGKAAKVTVDTGSSLLVLEKQYLGQYRKDPANQRITTGYGNGAKIVHGVLVYADVTLNTTPATTAVNVPILMVPNGTFHGSAGIMGVEMSNQTSLWKHLPNPYNQMMIIDNPNNTVTFGDFSNEQVGTFGMVQLNESRCNNTVKPESPYDTLTCWGTRKIPVTYMFQSNTGEVLFKHTYNTVFDTGGVLTHFFLQPIPQAIQPSLSGQDYQGSIVMQLDTNNQGSITLPATQAVKVFNNDRNVVNSGFEVFNQKAVLFDSRNGVIGFK